MIPARKASKRVPFKNIREVCGKPLLHYTIEAAKGAELVEDIVVSTEDIDIARLARKVGATVLTRPGPLARDDVPLAVAMLDVLEKMDEQGVYYDAILSLQVTSPLIRSETINEVIQVFHDRRCSAVATVSQIRHGHPYLSKRIGFNIATDFVDVPGIKLYPKRNLERAYYFNGAIFLRDRCLLMDYDYQTNALGSRVTAVEMDDEESVNIDTEFDFKIAKLLLEARQEE